MFRRLSDIDLEWKDWKAKMTQMYKQRRKDVCFLSRLEMYYLYFLRCARLVPLLPIMVRNDSEYRYLAFECAIVNSCSLLFTKRSSGFLFMCMP